MVWAKPEFAHFPTPTLPESQSVPLDWGPLFDFKLCCRLRLQAFVYWSRCILREIAAQVPLLAACNL